jgi:tRNA threonylcarbamoyladenosine biosynthesis protein TsaE
MKEVVCQSVSDGVTRAYARKLIMQLTHGGALLLQGELGAGKTTFVQGLAEALRVQHTVTSPTFTLLNVYETQHPVIQQLVHLDLYRLDGPADMTELDIATWLANPAALVVVEWPERAPELWHNVLGTIQFSLGSTMNQRALVVQGEIADYFSA